MYCQDLNSDNHKRLIFKSKITCLNVSRNQWQLHNLHESLSTCGLYYIIVDSNLIRKGKLFLQNRIEIGDIGVGALEIYNNIQYSSLITNNLARCKDSGLSATKLCFFMCVYWLSNQVFYQYRIHYFTLFFLTLE